MFFSVRAQSQHWTEFYFHFIEFHSNFLWSKIKLEFARHLTMLLIIVAKTISEISIIFVARRWFWFEGRAKNKQMTVESLRMHSNFRSRQNQINSLSFDRFENISFSLKFKSNGNLIACTFCRCPLQISNCMWHF